MKHILYILIILLVFAISCKNQDKNGTETNTELEEVSEIEATMEMTEETTPEDKSTSSEDYSLLVLSQMAGNISIDKSELPQSNLDSLKSLVNQHPVLESNGSIIITDKTVDVDFSKLVTTLSNFDEDALNTINLILPTKSSVAPGKSKNPFRGTFIEENLTGYSFYSTAKNSELYKKLEQASPEEAEQILAEHYGIKPDEVQLLKSIEKQPGINNEKQARKLSKPEYNVAVETALTNPNTSKKFKDLVNRQKVKQKLNAESFIRNSSKARKAFYELNPGWHGEGDEEIGNTYIDSRNKMIYLPLGELSFADAVIEHNPGNGGLYPKGALHEPDLLEDPGAASPLMCNIGLRGVLTLQFTNNAITDVNGPDLYVFEIGAIEPTILEISKDGNNWLEVGKIEGGTAMVDIKEFVKPSETFTYIRLTDLNTQSDVPGADIDAVAAIGGALRLNLDSSVLFEFGKYELKPEAEAALNELILQIEEMGKGTIVVEGHTDNVGSVSANKELSEKRAKSVSTLLEALMKDSAKNFTWQIKGYGDSQPLVPNNSDENRQKNRRVELLVLPQ
tara:strand:+ start:19559 stop:21250 length:1692 start_codon:yes stop_codon:yes gene_type:complete